MNVSAHTPEALVPRIGDHLVELGNITTEQLKQALDYQKEIKGTRNLDEPIPLVGQILVQLGFIDQHTLDNAVTDMIIKLKSALETSNQQLEQRVLIRTKELELAIKKINELNNSKSEFVSNISHELRTPLTHIMGYTHLMLDGTFGEITQDQQDALNAVRNASDRLQELIDDLISFTELENHEITIQPTPTSPFELCETAMRHSKKLANTKKIHLLQQCQQSIVNVSADREKILWVLRQLINNAIKFTPENGYVLLKVKQLPTTVEFNIIDTGIGIPKDRLNEIFEPFHQLDGSSTRSVGGTGIGLTISKDIIEAHNSKIVVYSEVGKGSEFKFQLPIDTIA